MIWRIGKVFGIEIRLHLFLLAVIFLMSSQWSKYGLEGIVFGVILASTLFLCILLHEFGHSLVAQHFGIPVQSITLWPLGGLALLTRRPKSPKEGLLISLAGPAVNVVISLLLFVVMKFTLSLADVKGVMESMAPNATTLLVILCVNNMALAVFNMMPAFPMDGGQVLLHALSFKIDPGKAMRITAFVARFVAVAVGTYAIFHFWFMVAAICVYIFISAPTRRMTREDIYG